MATKNNVVTFQYPRLTKENYDKWSLIMKTILGAQGVWDIVETYSLKMKLNYLTKKF